MWKKSCLLLENPCCRRAENFQSPDILGSQKAHKGFASCAGSREMVSVATRFHTVYKAGEKL